MSFDPRLPDESVNVSEGSVVREAILLVVGVAALAAGLTLALALSIEWVVPRIPVEAERWVFGAIGEHLHDAGFDADERSADVQEIVDRLAVHWPDAPYRFRVGVLDDELANAMALPGGSILVTAGLLERVANENELAFVLGHELGHFHGRDHLSGIGRGLAISLVAAAFGLGGDAASLVANTASSLSNRVFDRNQESDADLFGMELVVREYGHAGGATAVFECVLSDPSEEAQGRIGRAAERMGNYMATHPLGPARIDALRAHAEERGWALTGPLSGWIRERTESDAGGCSARQ